MTAFIISLILLHNMIMMGAGQLFQVVMNIRGQLYHNWPENLFLATLHREGCFI